MSMRKFIWGMISYQPLLFVGNIVFWGLVYLLPIWTGLISKQVFDTFAGHSESGLSFGFLLAMIIIVALVKMLCIYLGLLCHIHQDFAFNSLIRRNLLDHILKKPNARVGTSSLGEVMNHFQEDVSQAVGLLGMMQEIPGYFLFCIASFLILLHINATITLLVFVPMLIIMVVIHFSKKKLQNFRKDSREATSRFNGYMAEIFASILTIQLTFSQSFFLARFRKIADQRRKIVVRERVLSQVLDSFSLGIVQLGTGFILLVAIHSMSNGSFTLGQFALFVYYIPFIDIFIHKMGRYFIQYKQAEVSLNRLQYLLQQEDGLDIITQHHPLHLYSEMEEKILCNDDHLNKNHLESIEVKNLCYQFQGNARGIKGISFHLSKGSFTVITGRVGSGKTTLLRSFLGLLPMDCGKIYWNGEEIRDPGKFFVPPMSSYTPQVPHLYSATLKENILLGLPDDKEKLGKAVRFSELDRDLHNMENNLDTLIGVNGTKLSGGQILRTAVARMFMRETDLYVFDDISSALDIETELLMWDHMTSLPSTFLLVSNRKTVLTRADQIILIKEGSIEAIGTFKELMETSEEMKDLMSKA